jgi:lysophospholipase L1-like esterase
MRARASAVLALVVLVASACAGASPPLAREPLPPARAEAPPPRVEEEAPRAPPYALAHRDVNHVLVTGQSLAVGVAGAPPLSLTQPFANLMFDTGVMAGDEGLERFEPLVEGDTIPGSKVAVETISSAFANLAAQLAREGGPGAHDVLVSVHGQGAKTYAQLKKGTRPYERGLAQIAAARDIAKAVGKSYVVRAVLNVHGESDHAEKSTRYEADLLEWQADYEADARALTGQVEPVPMFETQISSFTRMMKGTETSAIPGAQLGAHVASDGKVVLVGPKYHLQYARDGVHLTNDGYRHLGEEYAKAYRRVVLEGRRWEPLRPIEARLEGATITVRFAVPAPPLVLDTELVSDPGAYGFEYTDSSGSSPSIARVVVTGPDTVAVTLSAAPTGDDRHLRYAFTGVKGARSGPRTGPRGNLRDSDATPSRTGHPLYNWCVHFDEPLR